MTILAVLAVGIFATGCTYDSFEAPTLPPLPPTGGGDAGTVDGGDVAQVEQVSFQEEVLPIFLASCGGGSACHGTGGIPPILTADVAYSELTSGKNCKEGAAECVNVDDPTRSQLYYRMSSQGYPMPPAGLLPVEDQTTVLWWIAQGAQEN